MTPSLFSSEYSRGPLYQYWKERSAEEKATRGQRIDEAKIRSQGFQPLSPASGPSSNDSYVRRATSGPPGYIAATSSSIATNRDGSGNASEGGLQRTISSERETSSNAEARPSNEDLPSYINVAGSTPTGHQPSTGRLGDHGEPSQLLSAEDEKARLAQLEEQRHQINQDAAIARSLSSSDVETVERHASVGEGSPGRSSDTRRKSTSSKIGRWLADAASGYSKKQERW
jgi:hypothetical protein